MHLLDSEITNQESLRKEIPEGTLAVNEIFYSIQGEGKYAGTPMIFIRLNLCLVGCNFCDTAYTWKRITHNRFMTKEEIMLEIGELSPKCAHVCFTGGEPFEQSKVLLEVCEYLHQSDYKIHIETSGNPMINPEFKKYTHWITCSPKKFNGINHLAQSPINEVKFLVNKNAKIEKLRSWISNFKNRVWISIQPIEPSPYFYGNFSEYSDQAKAVALEAVRVYRLKEAEEWEANKERAIEICKETGWSLSLQIHKYLNIR